MRNSLVNWATYNLIPLVIVSAAYIIIIDRANPADTMHVLAGRIASFVIPGIGTYIIARLVINAWGKRSALLVTPTALFFYIYVFILIVNRKDQLDLPSDFLFTLTVGGGLLYGLFIAGVKFMSAPSVFKSWQLFQSFLSTIGIGSIIGYGALRITDDFIRHISLDFDQWPFLIIGIPVIFMAQIELTHREIRRPYDSQDINDPAATD